MGRDSRDGTGVTCDGVTVTAVARVALGAAGQAVAGVSGQLVGRLTGQTAGRRRADARRAVRVARRTHLQTQHARIRSLTRL